MDHRLLKLARIAHAKLLITVRDPRDSVVSQRERFGLTLHQAAMEISQSLASIGSIPADFPTIHFVYEDGFTHRVQTVVDVAKFLEVEVDDTTIHEIFDSFVPDRIRERIAERQTDLPPDEDPGCDPLTLWHSTHVGDGRIGKWKERLDASSQHAVSGSLNAMALPKLRLGKPLTWPASFFTCNGSMPQQVPTRLTSDGSDDQIAYGPYLCLPRGRWRAVAMIESDSLRHLDVDAEIYLPWEDRALAQLRTRVSCLAHSVIDLDFDHDDYFQPLEARLRAAGGTTGACKFAGWKFFWLGERA